MHSLDTFFFYLSLQPPFQYYSRRVLRAKKPLDTAEYNPITSDIGYYDNRDFLSTNL
jgi:hypothetical protein